MSKTYLSPSWDNLSPNQKQLANEYVKSTLRALVAKGALINSLNRDDLPDELLATYSEFFINEPDDNPEKIRLLAELKQPFETSMRLDQLNRIPCFIGCKLRRKSDQDCNEECGTEFQQPLD